MKFLSRILLMAALAMTACAAPPPAEAQDAKASKTQAANRESEAVGALEKMGVPLHRDPSGIVRWIEAKKGELTDEAMAHLPALSRLEWLEIGGGKVSAAGAAHLKGCPELRRLYIYDINLAGDKLQWLAALTKLEALSLQRTGIDASIMENIKAPGLVVLNLSGNPVGDNVLDAAARIKELEVLALADTNVTGPGLEKLRGMQRLNELNLMRCKISDNDIDVFLSMPNLRIVYAEGCPMSDFGIQRIIMRFPTLAIFL
ncbi:MAG: hypothetical protein LBJ21_08010 [Acidobacteriota bacterium]|jgi:hypothetical protein|nr:hypothetical protein [Acidobacteriota bacterium]